MSERNRRAASDDDRERMLAATPLTERRVDLAGVSTAVLEGGQGSPLVLLHGAIECGGAIWAPVISALAEGHRLVVPDIPGLGESEPVERLDAAAFADWLAALLRATCREEPTLIAHSMGGAMALRFAAHHRELLRRLVVYAAPGSGRYRMPWGLLAVAVRFELHPTERNAERFDRWAFDDLDGARRRDPEWFEAFAAYNLSRAVVPHVKRTMRQLIGTGRRRLPDADLGRIRIPTALLWGRHDRFVALDLGQAASTRLGWPLEVIDDTGHVPHIERPEAFLSALRTALERLGADSGPNYAAREVRR
jgi:2-hydroxymuconate-semialdehyde hydrolase